MVAVVPIRILSSFKTLLSINVISTFSLRRLSPEEVSTWPRRLRAVRCAFELAACSPVEPGTAGTSAGCAAAAALLLTDAGGLDSEFAFGVVRPEPGESAAAPHAAERTITVANFHRHPATQGSARILPGMLGQYFMDAAIVRPSGSQADTNSGSRERVEQDRDDAWRLARRLAP